MLKAYIPLRRKKVALGPGVGLAPQRHYFALGIPTCRYLKMLKFAFPPTQNIKFAFPPTQNPNASQWNIGCVGSLALGLCVGHVHFIFFWLISFALGSRRKRSFQWNMGLSHKISNFVTKYNHPDIISHKTFCDIINVPWPTLYLKIGIISPNLPRVSCPRCNHYNWCTT